MCCTRSPLLLSPRLHSHFGSSKTITVCLLHNVGITWLQVPRTIFFFFNIWDFLVPSSEIKRFKLHMWWHKDPWHLFLSSPSVPHSIPYHLTAPFNLDIICQPSPSLRLDPQQMRNKSLDTNSHMIQIRIDYPVKGRGNTFPPCCPLAQILLAL